MNKQTSVIIGIIVVLGVGFFVYQQNSDQDQINLQVNEETETINNDTQETEIKTTEEIVPGTETETETPTSMETEETTSGYTAELVTTHDSRESCWSIINNNVYDLTSWIPNHPGGEQAILQLCGTDGSEKFNGKHGGMSRQEMVLAGFKIGAIE